MAHNGGKSQVVFWFLGNGLGGEFPFLNHMKTAQRWSCADSSQNLKPANFDANGYVHTITNGGVTTQIVIPSAADRPGNYVLKWDGTGTLSLSTHTVISGSLTTGRLVFSTTLTAMNVGVTAVGTPGTDYPTNIRFVHADDEALLDSGEMFSPTLKEKLAHIGVIRFLDWQLINTTQLRNFADQMPEGHYSYSAAYWKPSLYQGFTTNTGDAYAIGSPGGVLTDGLQILVTFNASATGYEPTMNWRDTGDIKIVAPTLQDISTDSVRPSIGQTAILTYNLPHNRWLKLGGDLSSFSSGLQGVPISVCLRLCKEVGAHPWLHIPYLAMDPDSGFATDLATYVKAYTDNPANDAAWMIPRYEPSNEVWNTAAGFYTTPFANIRETKSASTVWRGDWATATAYSVNDGVAKTFGGFICLRAHTSSATVIPSFGTNWATATAYVVDDGVMVGSQNYICLANHTSGTFNTDLTAGKWAATWSNPNNNDNWYGRALSIVGKAVRDVYGGVDTSKYHMICGGWAAQFPTGNFNQRLDSTRYVAETGQAGDAAKFWSTHVSVANYWHSSYAGTATELTLATEWLTASASRKAEIELDYLTSTSGSVSHHMENCKTRMTNWHDWGVARGVLGFEPYEGGYDYGYSEGSGDTQTFTRAMYFSPVLYDKTIELYEFIETIGEFPSQYTFSGASSWGYGGVGVNIYQADSSTQWDAILDYSSSVPGLSLGLQFGI